MNKKFKEIFAGRGEIENRLAKIVGVNRARLFDERLTQIVDQVTHEHNLKPGNPSHYMIERGYLAEMLVYEMERISDIYIERMFGVNNINDNDIPIVWEEPDDDYDFFNPEEYK